MANDTAADDGESFGINHRTVVPGGIKTRLDKLDEYPPDQIPVEGPVDGSIEGYEFVDVGSVLFTIRDEDGNVFTETYEHVDSVLHVEEDQ